MSERRGFTRTAVPGLVVSALMAGAGLIAASARAVAADPLPAIHHVWVIQLENESATAATGDDGYLGRTLPGLGVTLTDYYAVGHNSLDNYVAQISGQAPNTTTQDDCQTYQDVTPGDLVKGQATGTGCVYPSDVNTIADQLSAKGLTWKGYMEDMGNDPARDGTDAASGCGHPKLGSDDPTQSATAGDQYATRHDPFVYFHSIIDDPAKCENVVALSALADDLGSESTTPAFSWITPNLCDDGHDSPCAGADVAGDTSGGFTAIDDFLSKYVPMITGSPAFASGMLIVTFDEADTSDSSSCCGATPGPGASKPGGDGPGGGRVDTVVVSPFVTAGTSDGTSYNHYATMRTVEDIFGLPHLGEAANPGEASFGADVFQTSASPVTDQSAPTTVAVSATSGSSGGGSSSAAVIVAIVAGVLVVAGSGLFIRRRRRARTSGGDP